MGSLTLSMEHMLRTIVSTCGGQPVSDVIWRLTWRELLVHIIMQLQQACFYPAVFVSMFRGREPKHEQPLPLF